MNVAASPLRCFHLSNALTYGSLLGGVGAVAVSLQNRPGFAGALIAAAVVLDTFDGRFARMFRRAEDQRSLGAQLDSLSDAIAFGFAPALCMVALSNAAPAVWSTASLFVACAISRLAFYNVAHERTDGFVGLPAPVAALIWATALLIDPGIVASSVLLLATAVAMVLPLSIRRPRGLAFAAFVCWPLLVIVGHLTGS
jgi:CDP-diacylglycerol--serine O-phosphatidyltransferase